MCNYFLSGIFETGDIAFLISNLNNLDHNLFPDWNEMPYKCMYNTSPITVEQCERFLRTGQVTTYVYPISEISIYSAYVITSL